MDGINSDKVNIHLGGGESGSGGGLGAAALIAALGDRNQGPSEAGLIAALGNRNDSAGGIGALLAAQGGGMGGGGMWPILLLALLGGRGRGLFGGGDEGGGLAGEFLMSKLGTIEGSIPLAAANVSREICESTGTIVGQLNQATLATLAAVTNAKDATQAGTTAVLSAICGLGSKIDANQIADLQRQLAVAQSNAAEERHTARTREVEVNVSQNVSQAQQQAQLQTQIGALLSQFAALHTVVQRGQQDIVNLGTMVASGVQTSTNTAVR